jgi:hypothetical protein
VADLVRKGGLLCSERPAGLLRKGGFFTPKYAFAYVAHWIPFNKSVSTSVTSSTNVASTTITSPDLEIMNKIETSGGGSIYLFWVGLLNIGTGDAKNCVIEIEYHDSESEEYEYLGNL